VGHRLARVHGGLERLEDVLPADDDHGVDAGGEQRRHAVAVQPVALVLQPVDLDELGREVGSGAQAPQRLRHLLAGPDEHLGQRDGLLHRRLDPVQAERVAGLLGEVDDVVERPRQLVDVSRLEGRAAAPRALAVEPVDDVVGDAIALLLAQEQVARKRRALGEVGEHVAQQQARALDVAPRLLEQLEEALVHSASEERHLPPQPNPRIPAGSGISIVSPGFHIRFTGG